MTSCLNNYSVLPSTLPYTLPSILSNDTQSPGDVIVKPPVEYYERFLKDISRVLFPSGNICNVDDIVDIANRYGVNEDISGARNDNILSVIDKLKLKRPQELGAKDSLSQRAELRNDISEEINTIRNEIHNQALHKKYSSQQFKASTTMLEKELATNGEFTTTRSNAERWLKFALIIGEIKDNYVNFYADLMLSYTNMYESFNENVQKAASEAVSAGDDGNNVSFDTVTMKAGYEAFQEDVDRLNGELGSVNGWNIMTDDDKSKMRLTLEPAYKVDSAGKISFNMNQYNSVSGTYPSGIKDGKVSTASYQAWLATFNTAGNTFQSNMQAFAQRYTQANNNFDTLNKILSSAISILGDNVKDVYRSLS